MPGSVFSAEETAVNKTIKNTSGYEGDNVLSRRQIGTEKKNENHFT